MGPTVQFDAPHLAVRSEARKTRVAGLALVALWVVVIAFGRSLGQVAPSFAMCGVPLVALGGTAALLSRMLGGAIAGTGIPGAPGQMILDGERVVLLARGGRREISRGDVESGWTEPAPGGEQVMLVTKRGLVVRVLLPLGVSGGDVLAAAGVAPDSRTRVIRTAAVRSEASRTVLISMAMFVAMVIGVAVAATLMVVVDGAAAIATLALLGGFGVLYVVLAPLLQTTVRIGTDGVLVERTVRKKLVPRGDVTGVLVRHSVVALQRRAGPEVTIECSGPAEAEVVADQIRLLVLSPRKQDGARSVLVARLDRAGRSVVDWSKELRALVDVKDAYRATTFSPEELLAVARDAGAPRERRVAAAAALSACEDAEVRAGLRIAADASVDPKLRVAFERAAEGELPVAELERLSVEEAAK